MTRIALALALVLATPSLAYAATWGSFNASRIAYATGPLTGDNHADLRALIEAHGDEVASGTAELTAEYLADVDVFYTAMLSDGTGPTAGDLGTLSLAEAEALQAWVAAGGTLIVTVDSNGLDLGGQWPDVYDSFTQVYGVGGYSFSPGPETGTTVAAHAITEGAGQASFDGFVAFSFGTDAVLLATVTNRQASSFMAVLEPGTGFDVGGRLLVVGDHNLFTDPGLPGADNNVLAQNVIAWAAGECGNGILEGEEICDDGNTEGGDRCDATCGVGGGSEGSSGGSGEDSSDTSGESGETSGSSTSPDPGPGTSSGSVDDTSGTSAATAPGTSTGASASASNGDASSDGTDTSPSGEALDDSGCGCRGHGGTPSAWLLVPILGATVRRRSVRG